MAEQIAVRAAMDVDIEADKGQVRLHIHMAGETLVAVRLSPTQALQFGQKLLAEAALAKSAQQDGGNS